MGGKEMTIAELLDAVRQLQEGPDLERFEDDAGQVHLEATVVVLRRHIDRLARELQGMVAEYDELQAVLRAQERAGMRKEQGNEGKSDVECRRSSRPGSGHGYLGSGGRERQVGAGRGG